MATPAEGMIPVPGGRVWYSASGSGSATPLLALHGGPGGASQYLHGLGALGDDRPVVFYDQLGGGRSERPPDARLWTVARFAEELDTVRQTLGLSDIHIVGHSWGGLLALEHVLKESDGVRSVVLSSTPVSIPRYVSSMHRLRADLPSHTREALDRHEQEGTTSSPEYVAAVATYQRLHLCRRTPWPPEMDRLFAELGVEVYVTLWGVNSFDATGVLRTYDRTEDLSRVRVPVLFTTGRYCAVTPHDTTEYAARIPRALVKVFGHSAHMTMLEEPDDYLVTVRSFLLEHDRGA